MNVLGHLYLAYLLHLNNKLELFTWLILLQQSLMIVKVGVLGFQKVMK